MVFSGERDDYSWVEWDSRAPSLRDLLEAFPKIVMGRYLVNTSFDSGSLPLTESESADGWDKYSRLALSPVITSLSQIPFDQYDEWYVFESSRRFDDHEVFVNYGGFSLHTELYLDATERFWRQLSIIEPETYLSEGDNLLFVTKDKTLHEQISQWRKS